MNGDSRVGSNPADVDLEPAGRRTHLGKILVHAHHASSQIGLLFDQDDALADFGGLDRRRHPRDSPPDHQNRFCFSTHDNVSWYVRMTPSANRRQAWHY